MKNIRIALLLGACLLSASASAVTVQLKWAGAQALELSYILPAQCQRLSFRVDSPAYRRIRSGWQPLDDCAALEGGDVVTKGAACRTLRFRVPVSTDKVEGYPGAFPVGEGIYLHTSKYAVGAACGKVDYRFAAPGSIGMQGSLFDGNAASADGDNIAVLLMPRKLDASAAPIYVDPALPLASAEQVRCVAEETMSFYRRTMPSAHFRQPILTAAAVKVDGGVNIGGDAADVMRLSFFNWPLHPTPREQGKLALLVSHEISHRFQLRDELDDYPQQRLIHEGGGEFLRWYAGLQLGWLTAEQAAADLDNALADCQLGTAGKAWSELSRATVAMEKLDYSCGLAAYVYGLAARQGQGSALARIAAFYSELGQGNKPPFEQTLACGVGLPCSSRLGSLLGSAGPMAAQWESMLDETGFARRTAPGAAHAEALMARALKQLVQDDCGGKFDAIPSIDGMQLFTLPSCASLKHDLFVTRVEGHALYGDAHGPAAMAEACRQRGAVRLEGGDGATLTVACRRPYQPVIAYFSADVHRILKALDRP
ncbi:MAG: hypothetical protein V4508_20625 [Pseudomonadota bacterium]